MPDRAPQEQSYVHELSGPAKDFRGFIELELERRRSSDKDFDPELFDEAVELVLDKLRGQPADAPGG
jgi:hypothetical protein